MKRKSLAILSLLTAVCMLGACAESERRSEQISVIVVNSNDSSAVSTSSEQAMGFVVPENSSKSSVSTSSTSSKSSKTSSSSSSSSKVSVVVPEQSSQSTENSTSLEPAVSEPEVSEPVVSEPVVSEPEVSSSAISEPEQSSLSSVTTTTTSATTTTTTTTSTTTTTTTEQTPPETPVIGTGTNSYQALNYNEIKGMWISFIEMAGMSSGSESAFRSEISEVYENCAALGINTVFVHVRSHGDAYYNSKLYPRTKYLDGSYDPLPIMIEEAHKRGLSFQAWINPLRGSSVADLHRENGYQLYDWSGGTRAVEVNGYYYLNPGYTEVTDFIAKGAAEIVANYDVDGVHIDDYFYPTTESWFDAQAYAQSPYTSLSEFRFANCDRLVSSLYSAVKTANPTAIFGVSPQGNYQNNYYYMYADVEKWCKNAGYLDYIMPQIYFGYKHETQPFEEVVKQWDNIASSGRVPLIVGLAASKLGEEEGWCDEYDGIYEWINDKEILKRQFVTSKDAYSYGGVCLYRYDCLFNPPSGISGQVSDEVSALKSALNQ